jgi:hypothetical protein
VSDLTLNIPNVRLHTQQIARQRFDQPGDLVAWMGAMQAQDYQGESTLRRSNALLEKSLGEGGEQRRTDLLTMLQQHGISTAGQRAAHLLARAAMDGLICQGSTHANVPMYYSIAATLPPTPPKSREEGLAELARRYFTSHAPATLHDFVWWSGLPVGEARAAIASLGGELIAETVDGQTYWLPHDLSLDVPQDERLYLLPPFDEYLLGYRERGAVLDPVYAKRVVPGGNGVFYPIIVSSGQVVGVWKRTIKGKKGVVVSADAFSRLTEAEQAAFTDAAGRYAVYLGMALA